MVNDPYRVLDLISELSARDGFLVVREDGFKAKITFGEEH